MPYPFVPARWFTTTAGRSVDLVVVHDMEYPEKLTAAEDVAAYFKKGTVQASAHYCVDTDSVVQCVREIDVAWHAPGANARGIGIEHAGYASQRAEQWMDDYSRAELELSARLTADICRRYSIPIVFLAPADLLAGKRGITTHNNVSLAWKKSTHTDPGANFPMNVYLDFVKAAGPAAPPVVPPKEVPVANSRFVSLLVHPSGGYLQIGADGGVFAWNDTGDPGDELPFFYGSLGGSQLNAPIVDACWTPTHAGYWMLGADGGIFSFGDAVFHGSLADVKLNKPAIRIQGTVEGGYLIEAEDGGIFPYGPGAEHHGNALWSG